jgi:hypothetical protein
MNQTLQTAAHIQTHTKAPQIHPATNTQPSMKRWFLSHVFAYLKISRTQPPLTSANFATFASNSPPKFLSPSPRTNLLHKARFFFPLFDSL